MTGDEEWAATIYAMAQERGVSDAEMEQALIRTAQAWERSMPWYRRAWYWISDRMEKK